MISALEVHRKSWRANSKIPSRMAHWRMKDCTDLDKGALAMIRMWLGVFMKGGNIANFNDLSWCGRGLLLHGAPGLGKSTTAAAIMNEVVDTAPLKAWGPGYPRRGVRWMTWNDYVALNGRMISGDDDAAVLIDRIAAKDGKIDDWYRLIVVDDLGKEHQSGSTWAPTLLHDLVRTRFNEGLPTILTTNVSPDKFSEYYGEAMASFFKEAFFSVPFVGKDLRK